MDFRLLGPFGVYDDQGREVELGGRQQRIVLAMLLLHRNEVVSVDRLIDAVWDQRAPANAVKNVQIHVSRLRKALEGHGVLRTHAGGYVLEVGPDELDVDRFGRLVDEGRRALAAGSAEDAATTLAEALALWRGPPLADFAYDSFSQSEIGRLDELRLGAVEERLEADLALGRHGDVAAELQGLVAQHPLRERLRGQLMLALYRSGRKPDALRVYDEARRLLAEELGLEPGETLQRLHQAVLTDDPALAAPQRVAPTRAAAGTRAPLPPVARRRVTMLGVGGALLLAAAVAVAVLAVTRDQTSAGLVAVAPNSLAAIDPETNRVVAEIPVGIRPASVLFAHGSLWVANLDDDTVQRIDPGTKRFIKTIAIGTAPSGLVATRDAVWAIGADGVVLRIDPEVNDVVARIPTVRVGSLLGGSAAGVSIAATSTAVWAVSGGHFSVPRLFRIDPARNRAEPFVATGNGPTAVAVGFGDLWVTDSFENTVTRVDPAGVVVAPIPVGHGAIAIAVGEGAVWVADSLDDAVVRIDPETNSVVDTIPVGRSPSSIAVEAGAVWVGNRHDGTVSRIDPKKNEVVDTIEIASSPAGLALAAGSLWLTSQAGAGSAPEAASGGIARFSAKADFETDPARYPDHQINYATCAKLLNYPDAPAPAGTRLVPEVAASLPTVSRDGRTYTFTVRSGFAFSPPRRERVTAETFKYAIERSLHPKMGVAGSFIHDIAGQAAYQAGKAAHISGVVADGDRLTVTLVQPAADFPARMAMSFFCAVPLNTKIDPNGVREIPSAGPYYIAEHVPNQRIVLKRNPNYHGSRPRRLREIRYSIGRSPAKNVADVEAGRSDYLADGYLPPSPEVEAELAGRYGPASAAARNGRQRYFVNPRLGLAYLALNTSRPLFSDVRMRKAVNYAIDRRALARYGNLGTGPFPSVPTDQYLPPAMPGASSTALYPPSGDLRLARRLAPNARGTAVLYTCNLELCRQQARVIRSSLGALGLVVDVREFPINVMFEKATTRGEPYDIVTAQWGADWADPSTFLNVLLDQRITPRGNANLARFVDAGFARKLERVARLAGAARYPAYEALSVELARDAAPWVVFATGTAYDFFSARIGCQVFHPFYGIDLGRLCIHK
jgi:YVTN family beta-propeller protein